MEDVVNQHVGLSSTLVLVQRTALLVLTGHWTDNISNNLRSDYKISCFVFVANANCLHINIYCYHGPITEHAPLSQ